MQPLKHTFAQCRTLYVSVNCCVVRLAILKPWSSTRGSVHFHHQVWFYTVIYHVKKDMTIVKKENQLAFVLAHEISAFPKCCLAVGDLLTVAFWPTTVFPDLHMLSQIAEITSHQ